MECKDFLKFKMELFKLFDKYLAEDTDTPYLAFEIAINFIEMWKSRVGKDPDYFYNGILLRLYDLEKLVADIIEPENNKDGD